MGSKKVDSRDGKSDTTLRAAAAMALAGYGYDNIARTHSFSSAFAAKTAVEVLLGETVGDHDLQALRNKSLARKEKLLSGVWWDATHPFLPDDEGNDGPERNENYYAALDRAIRLGDAIDRLMGLNAPTQMEVYHPDAEEFIGTLNVLRQKMLEGQPEEGDIFDAEVLDDDESPTGDSNAA